MGCLTALLSAISQRHRNPMVKRWHVEDTSTVWQPLVNRFEFELGCLTSLSSAISQRHRNRIVWWNAGMWKIRAQYGGLLCNSNIRIEIRIKYEFEWIDGMGCLTARACLAALHHRNPMVKCWAANQAHSIWRPPLWCTIDFCVRNPFVYPKTASPGMTHALREGTEFSTVKNLAM
jgi:hypothetical protein